MSGSVIGARPARRARLAFVLAAATLSVAPAGRALAQTPADADTRAGRIAAEEQAKAKELKPYGPNTAEVWVKKLEEQFLTGSLRWHPFFDSAYSGGGFTLGAGYVTPVGDYNSLDLRGSYTLERLQARSRREFVAPRLFDRRGTLSVLGGWREATQVGFYGIGTGTRRRTTAPTTASGSRTRSAIARRAADAQLAGAARRASSTRSGSSARARAACPSVEEVYTPETLPGLGAEVTYLHTQGTRRARLAHLARLLAARRLLRRHGCTTYADADDRFGFRQVDYEAIQHIPILRDAWVLSLHGARRDHATRTTASEIPFFMLPALGGGSSLRGFPSWRFRDRNSLLLQAEWRVLVNRFFDTAIFYDAGKVTGRRSDLDLDGLKNDYGIGFRFHGPAATPLRIELAKSNEGLALVFCGQRGVLRSQTP